MNRLTAIFTSITCLFLLTGYYSPVAAQSQHKKPDTFKAVITEVIEEKTIVPEFGDQEQPYQKLKLSVISGQNKGDEIVVENGIMPTINPQTYEVGDKVIVNSIESPSGLSYVITDQVRTGSLLWLFLIFVALTAAVGRVRGLTALVGMAVSFFIIFSFILPQIASGRDPILVAIAGSLVIIPVTFYLSHGFNKKTTVAIAGTLIALVFTGLLAGIFVEAAGLTGYSSEEAGFLQVAMESEVNIKGLLLGGIIIGVLGVLDDITVSQSAIVFQLKQANPKLKFEELYKRAMDVGHDHISSMVNTLVLVYTGASLPLLLLFIDSPQPIADVINYEIIADEIVRTLVGSIGLIMAVPVTTLIAVFAIGKK